MTLSNYDLLNIAKQFGINNLKVIMNDELEHYPFETGYYIINLMDSTDIGSHWVALIIEKGRCLYFDSFGVVPSLQVEEWMHQSQYKYQFNNKIIQNLDSVNCGYFALGLIIYVIKDTKKNLYDAVNSYINLFSNDNKKNDYIILSLFRNKFKNVK